MRLGRCAALAVLACAAAAPAAHAHWLPRSYIEPYRFAGASAGRTPTPAAATVAPGAAVSAQSGERGAQVVVYLPPGALRGAGRAMAFRAQPLPAGAETLHGGEPGGAWKVLGNVYRVSAPGARVTAAALNEIRLRAPGATRAAPVLARFEDGAWHPLPTDLRSGGVYSAPLGALGDYALVQRRAGGGSRRSLSLALAPLGLALLGVGGGLALRGRGRGRR